MLDKLPPWLQHLLLAAGAAFAGTLVSDVIAAHGVTGVDWLPALVDAGDLAAVAVATTAAALWGLPITRSYGVGAPRALGRHEAPEDTTGGVA